MRADQHRARSATRGTPTTATSTSSPALTVSEDTYFYLVGAARERRHRQRPRDPERGARAGPRQHARDRPRRRRQRRAGPRPRRDRRRSTSAYVAAVLRPARRAPKPAYAHATARDQRRAPRATTTRRGRSARTCGSRPGRATSRRARCRWRSPTRRSSTAARSGSPQIGEEILTPVGPARRSSCRRRRYRHVDDRPRRPAAVMAGPARRRAEPVRHLVRGVRQLPADRSTARPARPSHTGKGDQSWYVGYVPDGARSIVDRGDDRAGRLRRRRRGARGAADALAVVRAAEGLPPGTEPGPLMAHDARSRRPSRAATRRRCCRAGRVLRIDLMLAFGGDRPRRLSRWSMLAPLSHAQMVRQARVPRRRRSSLMLALSRIDYSRLRELKWGLYVILIGAILLVIGRRARDRGTGSTRSITISALLLPGVRVRQGAADRVPRRVRRRQLAQDLRPRARRPRDAARARAGDARDRRARPRLGPRLHRDRGRRCSTSPARPGSISRRSPCSASSRSSWSWWCCRRSASTPCTPRSSRHRGLPASVVQSAARPATSSTSRRSRSAPGGKLGRGAATSQTTLGLVPEPTTDFIFAVDRRAFRLRRRRGRSIAVRTDDLADAAHRRGRQEPLRCASRRRSRGDAPVPGVRQRRRRGGNPARDRRDAAPR